MKRLWFCIAVSVLCHALFFPDFLQAMLDSGAANKVGPKAPERVQIRLAPKKPKAQVAKVDPKPQPKPPSALPKPQVKPKSKPPEPKPVATRPAQPVKKPTPRTEPPARRETLPRRKPTPPPAARREVASDQPATRAPRSTRRLSGSGRPRDGRPITPQRPPGDVGGRAGETPLQPGSERLPLGDRDDGGSADPGPSNRGTPGPESTGPGPSRQDPAPRETPPPRRDPTPAPKEDPPPRQDPPPRRDPSPGPKMREATIEVPTIKLPANLRRESLKASLQLRAVIGPDGSVDFKLSESSGNSEVDDYVLAQVRQVAVATAALDDNGQPKRTMKRVRVDIEVD